MTGPVVTFESDPAEVWALYAHVHGGLAFDVGANGGLVTDLLAKNFEQVIAFEPCEESFRYLNEHPGDLENVTCEMIALSDHEGVAEFRVAEVTAQYGEVVTGHSLDRSWGPSTLEMRALPTSTLDHKAVEYGVPDFVKIDTEGHELKIVEGGPLILQGPRRPALLIEVHSQGNGAAISALLEDYDLRRINHPGYAAGTDLWGQHYYLVDERILA